MGSNWENSLGQDRGRLCSYTSEFRIYSIENVEQFKVFE